MKDLSFVRGEKPTRAGPNPRAEAAGSSAAGDGPWGRTRFGPRGPGTKWSASSELLRCSKGGATGGAPVRFLRVACDAETSRVMSMGWSRIDSSAPERDYRHREARWRTTMTAGTLTSSEPEWSGEVTARYKPCEVRVECGGEVDGRCHFLGALSISRLRPSPWSSRTELAEEGKLDTEGSNRSGRMSCA